MDRWIRLKIDKKKRLFDFWGELSFYIRIHVVLHSFILRMCPYCFGESCSWRLWRFDLESDALIASHVIICCSGFHPLCDGPLCSFSPGLRAFRRRSDKDQQPSADTAFNSCVAAQPLLSALTASYLDLYHFSFSHFQHATDFSCSVAIRLCCIRTSIRVTHTCLVSCSISSLRICMCFPSPVRQMLS